MAKPRTGRALVARPPTPLVPDRPVAGTNVIPTQLYRIAELHPAGRGPWANEFDKVGWIDPATSYPCTILRHGNGTLAGHVAVAQGHPLHGYKPDAIPPDMLHVHGGVNYAGECQRSVPDDRSICHVSSADARSARTAAHNKSAIGEHARHEDVWWLGFSTDTSVDLFPTEHRQMFLASENGAVYRDERYVAQQCTQLAQQLHAIEHDLPAPVLAVRPPPLGLEPRRPVARL